MTTVGEGNGTPLQYSCLENPMDGGAWLAAVHGVTKSQAWLSNFTFTFHFSCIGERNGKPLQCSCLENPRDGGASWLLSMGVHRVGHDWSDLAAASAVTTINLYYSNTLNHEQDFCQFSHHSTSLSKSYISAMLLKNMIHFLRVSVQLQITLTGVFHWSTCVFLNYGFHFHFSLSCIGEGNGNPL